MAAIARDWGAIGLVAISAERVDHWAYYLLAVWIIGRFQFALGEALLHEASHYHLFSSRRLHHWLECLYALPFLKTLRGYRAEHLRHHAALMKPGDQTVEDYAYYGLAQPHPNLVWIWFIRPLLGFPAYLFLRYGHELNHPRSAGKILSVWVPMISVLGIWGHLDLLFWYWLVPLFWALPTYNYWSEIEEHYNTRTGARSNLNRLGNLLNHNEGYHWIHHRYPAIPFYHLAAAHHALAPADTDVSHGFLQTFRQLKAVHSSLWICHPSATPGSLRDPRTIRHRPRSNHPF